MTAVFMIGPIFGLPLIGRYVRTAAVLLTPFYGLAVCGWLLLEPGRARRIWMWVGIAAAAFSVAFLPWHFEMLRDQRDNLQERALGYERLQAVAQAPGVARAVAQCGDRVSAAEHRVMPHLRWWMDTPPFSLSTVEAGASPMQDVFVGPRDNRAMRRFYRTEFPRTEPPADFSVVARNAAWRVAAAPPCVTRPPG